MPRAKKETKTEVKASVLDKEVVEQEIKETEVPVETKEPEVKEPEVEVEKPEVEVKDEKPEEKVETPCGKCSIKFGSPACKSCVIYKRLK